jgi:phenylacetate-CoA ligase
MMSTAASQPAAALPNANNELHSPARLPGLGAHGQAMLARLREHPAAPLYRNFSGHRLTRNDQWRAQLNNAWLRHAAVPRQGSGRAPPAWMWAFLARHAPHVAAWPTPAFWWRGWAQLPTTQRADLQAQLAAHVPWHRQNERLLCFTTSGTTGHPIRVPSTPLATAAYQALHERALALHGVRLRAHTGDVGIVLVGYQQRCFTYVSVNPLRGECGLAKINLHPSEWRHTDDRARYLNAMQPELISGDPVSLSALAQLPFTHRPRALLCTSMALSEGLRQRLETRFGCPVVDLYSMNEVGPIAAYLPAARGHVLLQPRLYVEILNEAGAVLPSGELGEITVSGGNNPCLPLLRYRTGDHGRLVTTPWGPTLMDLQGRPPVCFLHAEGHWVNNVELTQALRALPLRRFALHQSADRSFHLRVDADVALPLHPNFHHVWYAAQHASLYATVRTAVCAKLGECALHISPLQAGDKVVQYTSDLPQASTR